MKRFPIAVLALRRGGKARLAVWFALCVLAAVNQAVVFAQTEKIVQLANSAAVSISASPEQVEAYWTSERMRNAIPVVAQPASVDVNGYPTAAQGPTDRTRSVEFAGAPPTVPLRASDAKVLIPGLQDTDPVSVVPTLTSSFKAHFTTSRVFPDAAVSAYPNLAAGKLFFRDQGAGTNNVCSASVIRHRIVVTAGHCVAKPSTNPNQRYFYTNFRVRTGVSQRRGSGWRMVPRWVLTTNTWIQSNGSSPTLRMWHFLSCSITAAQRIGNVTGFLGWAINKLSPNHITSIGYPVNLDSGNRMEINNSQDHQVGRQQHLYYWIRYAGRDRAVGRGS